MARRRKRSTRSTKIGDDLQRMVAGASEEFEKEIAKVANNAAQVAHKSYDRELKATGLQRSNVSGSADLQSSKAKNKASNAKSIFDTLGEVVKRKRKDGSTYLVAKGGSDIDSNYIAGFWDRDDPKMLWGRSTGETLNEHDGVDAEKFARNAFRTAKSQIDAMFSSAFEKVFRKL